MSRIRILPEEVANKIAAGEVVERPSSVVKELVENAIDAGARNIRIFLEKAGKKLIRVEDDGEGMNHDDLLLAFERHATSKIKDVTDLMRIVSLGFRGEALPSIASVSRLRIRSKTEEAVAGVEVYLIGGVVKKVSEVPMTRGTSVEVASLFFNTPARRKFLRGDERELAYILEVVTNYALSYPEISFSLHNEGRELIFAPKVEDVSLRIQYLFGGEVADSLLTFDRERNGFRVWGFTSRPGVYRSSSRDIRPFVNRRSVKDRVILRAVISAYDTFLPKGRYPISFLFLELPPEEVDVNVHPTKAEVRFRNSYFVSELIKEGLREALVGSEPVGLSEDSEKEMVASQEKKEEGEFPVPPPSPVREDAPPSLPLGFSQSMGEVKERKRVEEEREDEGGFRIIGQHKNSYIIASMGDDIVIVDQHAAHERILYTRISKELEGKGVTRQVLLHPKVVELSPAQGALLSRYLPLLLKIGFLIEPFGGRSFIIKEVPALLPSSEVDSAFDEIIERMGEGRSLPSPEELLSHLLKTVACHSAIRAGDALSRKEMEELLSSLLSGEYPLTCPHGRPVIFRIDYKTLLKRFERD
ncbi:MAG: DNA mismatch repair endonuclease MutL [Acidobacteria bacterium]|nr:DNA mismatch repair endonuclease MutL [Acidobacteriota bacterium]